MVNTDDTHKMLRAIINGQSVFRQDVLGRIDKLEGKLTVRIDDLEEKIVGLDGKIDGVEKRLTNRIDKLGKQLAYLEDDAPTREEFEDLERKVDRINQKIPSS